MKDLVGCGLFLFIILCIVSFLLTGAVWLVLGSIVIIAKMISGMAYLGGAFLLIALISCLFLSKD